MIITGKMNEKENEKVKAFINLQLGEYQLRGFKLYENEEKQIKLITPTYMEKDENGQYKKDKEGKVENRHPIIINPELNNKSDVFKKLEDTLVSAYKEFKEKGVNQINKEVEIPEVEKGELNLSTFVVNPKNTKNADYQLKSNNSLFIGAFKVNEVNLIYNTNKNDFNVIFPSYGSKNQEGQVEDRSFIVPKTADAYERLKKKLVDNYKVKNNEFKNKMKEQNLEKEQKNLSQKASQVENKNVENNAPTLK